MSSQTHVIVVGGGIGGLFLANALVAEGIAVDLYEQARALGEVGAGVYITPNSVRQLDRLGLGAPFRDIGAPVGEHSRYYRHSGDEIGPVQVSDSRGWKANFGVHRADLIDVLASALPDGVLHTGRQVSGYEERDGGAAIRFGDGESAECDVVIGADGIHSTLRPHVHQDSVPVFSGTAVYRGLVPRALLPNWRDDVWQMWLGPGKHFLTFPVRSGELINFVAFVTDHGDIKESWTAPGDPDALRTEFAGWDPRIGELLSLVASTFRWALYDRDPLPTWTRGRLALLGDAAHPMLPHLGQGANQSIEDGMALAAILSRTARGRIPAALRTYEELRRERVASVQLGARRNGLRYDSMTGDLDMRDAEIRAHSEFRREIYDYDVVPFALAAADGLR